MSKKSKQPGKCIFCGGGGLTKQHVWPDWIKNVLPRAGSEHIQHTIGIKMKPPNFAILIPGLRFRKGHTGVRKIRNVCKYCNSGWMSQLENAAKPHLSKLILGDDTTIENNHQLSIAAWTVMTSIIAEFTDRPTASIPAAHRQLLKASGRPPEGWIIWIGSYYGTEWRQRYKHHGLTCIDTSVMSFTQAASCKPGCNTQTSTFVMGELFIHTLSSTLSDLHMLDFTGETGEALIRIWPPYRENIKWPRPKVISDVHADFIADAFFQSLFINTANLL